LLYQNPVKDKYNNNSKVILYTLGVLSCVNCRLSIVIDAIATKTIPIAWIDVIESEYTIKPI